VIARAGQSPRIEGAWRVTVTAPNFEGVFLVSFFPGGVLIAHNPPVTEGVPGSGLGTYYSGGGQGSWEHVGERRYTFTSMDLNYDLGGQVVATKTIRATVELTEDGHAWTGPAEYRQTRADGRVVDNATDRWSGERLG